VEHGKQRVRLRRERTNRTVIHKWLVLLEQKSRVAGKGREAEPGERLAHSTRFQPVWVECVSPPSRAGTMVLVVICAATDLT
jgi:hypothetical protein